MFGMESMKEINESLMKLQRDVELIKNVLMSEGELTDWAKKELERARKEKKTISHEELKRELGL